ncbi:MAG: DUF1134 domain-containing protein [Hyphomicrobium sp.]
MRLTVFRRFPSAQRLALFMGLAVLSSFASVAAGRAANDAYSPEESAGPSGGDAYSPPPHETYEPYRPLDRTRRDDGGAPGAYGQPYSDQPNPSVREEHYEPVPPPAAGGPSEEGSRGTYTQSEIIKAGHGFFGTVSNGLASAVEWAFQKAGRPNGYILGQDAGGAIVAGVRYGEGVLYTKDAGDHKVFWQGPSVGYDLGAEGSKVMTLVYNLRDTQEIYNRFVGVEGSAYLVGGVSVQFQKAGEVSLAPIRSGVGVRLGANVGYLKYTRQPTWNPF